MDNYEPDEQDRNGLLTGIRNCLIITAATAAAVALTVTSNPVSSSLKDIYDKGARQLTPTFTCNETPQGKTCERSSPMARRIRNIIPGI
jgi:hypothetical protein